MSVVITIFFKRTGKARKVKFVNGRNVDVPTDYAYFDNLNNIF